MPLITVNDIKLLASARMVDAADGGGQMSGAALQDGAENNVFPDISTVDRATGALALRKVYPAVLNTAADALLDAHLVLDDTPDDPNVTGLLIAAASNPQTVSGLTAALNAAGEAFGFYGSAAVQGALASGAASIPVAGLRAPLIPKSQLTEAVSGGLEATGAQPTVVGWVPTGQTVPLSVLPGAGVHLYTANYYGKIAPGSVAGTFTAPGGAGTVSCTTDGQVTLTAPGFSATLNLAENTIYPMLVGTVGLSLLTDVAITAEALVKAQLPQRKIVVPPVDGRVVYEVALPPGTVVASEAFHINRGGSFPITGNTANGKETFSVSPDSAFASVNINRATGLLTILLASPLAPGNTLEVTYAEGGSTTPLAPATLVSSGLFTGNTAAVTVGAGLELVAATFNVAGGEAGLSLLGGIVRNTTNTVRGSASTSGTINMPGNDGRSISGWFAAQFNPNYGVASVSATLPTNISPATLVVEGQTTLGVDFSATASAAGVFSTAHVTGTYDPATGALNLTFAGLTKLRSLTYEATRNQPQTSFADLYGLDAAQFAEDGTVPILKPGNLVVLRHTAAVAAATYANGNTVNCGRTELADIRVRDAYGLGIAAGWTANLATGVLTVNDITGWAQPVTVHHSIEHVTLAQGTPNAGTVTLSRALTRAFPEGSLLCSALRLGDLQARVGESFAQASWTNVWQDTRIGDPIVAQYQQAAEPIVVTNAGAVTERWALIFTSTTQFRVVGETLGQITTGDINSPLAPINPATGMPYFTVAAEGWGTGWAAGQVLRFNTTGANAPVWAARVVRPSAPDSASDSLTIAVRGDIDA